MWWRGFFFFFSSRRRHTRFDCDWSSDVCSSDLVPEPECDPGEARAPQWGARGAGHDVEGDADQYERAPAEQYEIRMRGPHAAEREPGERQELRPVQLDRRDEPDGGARQQPDRRPRHVLERHAHGGSVGGGRGPEAGTTTPA